MAILTWQNVPAPDLSGSQQGLRTAGDLLQKAVAGGTAIADQLAATEAANRAADQQTADRLAMQQILSARDSAQAQQMQRDGTAYGPFANKVSIETMLKADARPGVLLERENAAYNLDRSRANDRGEDEFARLAALSTVAPDATEDTKKAQAGVSSILAKIAATGNPLSADSASRLQTHYRNLFHEDRLSKATRAFEYGNKVEAKKISKLAHSFASRYLQGGDLAASKLGIIQEARKVGAEQNIPELESQVVFLLEGMGEDPKGQVVRTNSSMQVDATPGKHTPEEVKQAVLDQTERLQKQYKGLTPSSHVVMNARGKEGQSVLQVANELGKKLPGANINEFEDFIHKATGKFNEKAVKAGVRPITFAEAGGLLENHMQSNGIWNWANFTKEADALEDKFLESVGAIEDARIQADKYTTDVANFELAKTEIAEADKVRAKANSDAQRAAIIAESKPAAVASDKIAVEAGDKVAKRFGQPLAAEKEKAKAEAAATAKKREDALKAQQEAADRAAAAKLLEDTKKAQEREEADKRKMQDLVAKEVARQEALQQKEAAAFDKQTREQVRLNNLGAQIQRELAEQEAALARREAAAKQEAARKAKARKLAKK